MVTRSMALLSLKVWRETNSHSSQEREAILLLHDIYKVLHYQLLLLITHLGVIAVVAVVVVVSAMCHGLN